MWTCSAVAIPLTRINGSTSFENDGRRVTDRLRFESRGAHPRGKAEANLCLDVCRSIAGPEPGEYVGQQRGVWPVVPGCFHVVVSRPFQEGDDTTRGHRARKVADARKGIGRVHEH